MNETTETNDTETEAARRSRALKASLEAPDIISAAHEDALGFTDKASEALAHVCRDCNEGESPAITVKDSAVAVLVADEAAMIIMERDSPALQSVS